MEEAMDFDGNESVIIKYGAFTLCYSKLLAHLDEFDKPLRGETQLSKKDICTSFDEVLHKLYLRGAPKSFIKAIDRVIKGLEYPRDLIADTNEAVAEVLAAIIADIKASAPNWRYRDDVKRWQALGQKLAQCFYEDSPYGETQRRLARDVALHFEYAGEKIQLAPFSYCKSRLGEGEKPASGVITVRFSFHDDFINYLLYPFFFLHEYVSHIYCAETGSELFEDGWLLYAAHVFFKREALRLDIADLADEHLQAFDERIRPNLKGMPRRGFNLAFRAEDWLDRKLGPREGIKLFAKLSRHLATLVPGKDVDAGFHDDFIYTFSECCKEMPDQLLRWLIETEGDAIALSRKMSAFHEFLLI